MVQGAVPLMPERWYELEGQDCAHQVVSICRALETSVGAPLRQRWLRARSMYEARNVSLELAVGASVSSGFDGGARYDDELYNVSRSAVDTGQAEIAARQRPKPMFLTTDADWRTKRKAKKLGRFSEAILNQRQGARYADSWELGEDVFRDAEIAVGGVIKVSVDLAHECIVHERVPAYEVLVDPVEARGGDPRNWFQHYPMDADSAIERFCDSVDDKTERERIRGVIEGSTDFAEMMAGAALTERTRNVIRVFEAWHLPPSADKPGKHVFACSGGMLHEEEWTWPMPPFAFLIWSKEAFGIWGTGLVESGATQHEKINELSRNMHERVRLGTTKYIFYQPGTVDTDTMKGNDGVIFVICNDMTRRPQESNVPAITEAETSLLETELQRYYNLQGVSQMSAEARKEPGVESGIALQTVGDQKAVRFLPKSRAYELLFVRLGELDVRAMRDLAVSKPDYVAKWPGKKFLESIPWKEVDIEDEKFTVRVAPVSAMSNDPGERLEIIEKLTGMGYLSRDKYLELLGMPDLDSMLSQETAETQWVEKLVDRYLDSEDDDELKKRGGYREPDGYLLSPVNALATVAQHYFDALVNDAPEYSLNLLRRFMRSLQRIIEPKIAPPAAAGPALTPGQPAVPMGPPGAAIVPPQGAPVGVAA